MWLGAVSTVVVGIPLVRLSLQQTGGQSPPLRTQDNMGRRSPNYHIEVDRKSESFRPGSVTSSDLSDSSSLGKKSNAPKIVAVIIVSLAIVAVLVGVTVYLIDAEKAKQKIERRGFHLPKDAHLENKGCS